MSKKDETSKQRTNLEHNVDNMFFSLVDYKNKLFMENRVDRVIRFYQSFDNSNQLIKWMKERPKGVSYIHEIEGDKDIIVVIPTADFNGKYAKECRENIFKGLHIVFVESGGKDDFYFNYAHNCNIGISKAMEYNPKWIVLSNDDMYKIYDIGKLRGDLNVIENEADLVWTMESNYHSYNISIRRNNIFGELFKLLSSSILRIKPNSYFGNIFLLKKVFHDEYFAHTKNSGFINISSREVSDFKITSNFAIFSYDSIKKLDSQVFDETYINGYEDIDLSIRLHNDNIKQAQINYNIGDFVGSTLGVTLERTYRDIANITYFNYKIEKKFLNIKKFQFRFEYCNFLCY